jgi:hypothetical protein
MLGSYQVAAALQRAPVPLSLVNRQLVIRFACWNGTEDDPVMYVQRPVTIVMFQTAMRRRVRAAVNSTAKTVRVCIMHRGAMVHPRTGHYLSDVRFASSAGEAASHLFSCMIQRTCFLNGTIEITTLTSTMEIRTRIDSKTSWMLG